MQLTSCFAIVQSESNVHIFHVEREYNLVEIYNLKMIISIISFTVKY